uniref:Sec-independent protein translocase protein n=1 Tax=Zygnema circumcarinatum TaxID=35869 RepID=A0A6N0GXI3_ZYGCR|nr:Sec-independent protein translocase protein [Zygnema circumcarinatum]QKQ14697.1 Sec-independent protein translocase protein [Zygnema circumcarinatum]WEL36342.1 Sec-independent protein translocase protein [Zygnema circumcarinatum]
MYSALNQIGKEIRIRALWLILSILLTFVCCYTFSEELLFLLAKPFIVVSKPNSYFLSTQLTETLTTYVTSSVLLCLCVCTPYGFYQMWCFFIPSCNQTQRAQLNRYCVLSTLCLISVVLVLFVWILPTIWSFLYHLNKTSTNLLTIQLQPKIYDFIMLTVRFVFLSSVCSQIPVILLSLIEYNVIELQDCVQHRRSVWFSCVLIAALLTPPDLWCQLTALLLIYFVIEFTIFYALIRVHYDALCCSKR